VVRERGLDGSCVLDVNGVGYELFVPLGTLGRLPDGEETTLHVHTHVREDAILLYGFADATERAAFRTMLGVSGVGPKLALAVLSSLDVHTLARAIAAGDATPLKGISGVGKKTAERLLLELRDKLPAIVIRASGGIPIPGAKAALVPAPAAGPLAVVQSALVTMGFKPQEASSAIARITETQDRSPDDLLREALGYLA
jgi:Holliday junction DNA helicase RuvA